jgi:hypothetical protein
MPIKVNITNQGTKYVTNGIIRITNNINEIFFIPKRAIPYEAGSANNKERPVEIRAMMKLLKIGLKKL